VLTLFLVPFLDRGQMVKVTRRTVAWAAVILLAIGWGRADGSGGDDDAASRRRSGD